MNDFNQLEVLLEDGKKILQSFTPQELDAFKKGTLYGAHNHKAINRRCSEWCEKHNASIEEGKRNASAVCEAFKGITGLGKAVENIANMKTYEEVRDSVLEKLIHGLVHNPEERKEFMKMLQLMDEQDKAERERQWKR